MLLHSLGVLIAYQFSFLLLWVETAGFERPTRCLHTWYPARCVAILDLLTWELLLLIGAILLLFVHWCLCSVADVIHSVLLMLVVFCCCGDVLCGIPSLLLVMLFGLHDLEVVQCQLI